MPKRYTVLMMVLFSMLFAGATTNKNSRLQITVLDSHTRAAVVDDSGVPKNCDGPNYDAYCHSSESTVVTNDLLIQAGSDAPYWITCSADSKRSRCAALPVGGVFDARTEKHGLTVFYVDEDGSLRKQTYTFVSPDGKPLSRPMPVPVPAAAGTAHREAHSVSEQAARALQQDNVKCSFISTPPGAEITVDGKFSGSTPSTISLALGKHDILMQMPGYRPWSRELEVSAGSHLTVNAVMQRSPGY